MICVTFDNLGEVSELERGQSPASRPLGRHFSVTRALPLVKAQQRRVKALEAPRELRAELARWFDLQDRRLGMLEKLLGSTPAKL